jgi:hypothetical protein
VPPRECVALNGSLTRSTKFCTPSTVSRSSHASEHPAPPNPSTRPSSTGRPSYLLAASPSIWAPLPRRSRRRRLATWRRCVTAAPMPPSTSRTGARSCWRGHGRRRLPTATGTSRRRRRVPRRTSRRHRRHQVPPLPPAAAVARHAPPLAGVCCRYRRGLERAIRASQPLSACVAGPAGSPVGAPGRGWCVRGGGSVCVCVCGSGRVHTRVRRLAHLNYHRCHLHAHALSRRRCCC